MNFYNKYKYDPNDKLQTMYDDPVQRAKDLEEFRYKPNVYPPCPYEPNTFKDIHCGWMRVCDFCPNHNYTTFKNNPDLLLRLIKYEVKQASEEVMEQSTLIDLDFSEPLERLKIVKDLIEEYLKENKNE